MEQFIIIEEASNISDEQWRLLEIRATKEKCRVLGHIPRPLFFEDDGAVDLFICTRCGELI